jgi:hypothetical protein
VRRWRSAKKKPTEAIGHQQRHLRGEQHLRPGEPALQ